MIINVQFAFKPVQEFMGLLLHIFFILLFLNLKNKIVRHSFVNNPHPSTHTSLFIIKVDVDIKLIDVEEKVNRFFQDPTIHTCL